MSKGNLKNVICKFIQITHNIWFNIFYKNGVKVPIKIPKELPVFKVLSEENIFFINTKRTKNQDIRPLKIAIFNLMPLKVPIRKSNFKISIEYTYRTSRKIL